MPETPVFETRRLSVTAGRRTLLRDVDLVVDRHRVLALIGPSGVGKSTLLRCFNRMIELSPGLTVRGQVLLDGADIYASGVDADALRGRIGMLFQQPVIFPCSILDNVLFGLRATLRGGRRRRRRQGAERARQALLHAALWDEVADRLDEPAESLSVGQQQRLCLARALALDPEVLLMDEPTSALDPRSTAAIEERIVELASRCSIVLVTHDLGQARRVAHRAACLRLVDGVGELLECDVCDALLERPQCREVFATIQGEKTA